MTAKTGFQSVLRVIMTAKEKRRKVGEEAVEITLRLQLGYKASRGWLNMTCSSSAELGTATPFGTSGRESFLCYYTKIQNSEGLNHRGAFRIRQFPLGKRMAYQSMCGDAESLSRGTTTRFVMGEPVTKG